MYEAVYHPWMYCRKTENFLGALILWDRIFTITPRSYVSDDINPFHQKLLMNNVIKEIDLRNQQYIIEDTARNFENLCKNESVFNFVIESMKNFDGFDETHFRIHHEKTIISQMLRIQKKIKEYRIECSDRWVYLPRELTALYMFILAETIAKIRGASLLSDLDETYALYKRFFIRVCPERLFPNQPPEHQADHSDADEGNGGAEILLVMAYEASAACEP